MNNNILGVGIVALAVGLFLGTVVMPQMNFGGMMGPGGGSVNQGIDRHFIEEMIPHHEGAIAMAKLALERSKRPEMLLLANGIIEAQTREINDMKGWYEEWFGTAVPAYSNSGGMMGGMGHGAGMQMGSMVGDLEALKAAANFDLEFIRQMIPHHEMAVMMARMLAAGTARTEMQTLADNIITSQSREIEMMQGWYAAWK